jgi:hypothetical protein
MRVTSDLWVSALLRQVFSAGGFGAVLQRGGDSAGAIFIVTRNRLGEATLFGPAPQTGYSDAKPDDRLFVELLATTDEARIEEKLARERRFDPDLWLIEIEPGGGSADLFRIMKP